MLGVRETQDRDTRREATGAREQSRRALNATGEAEWRYPDHPTIQISLPYVFVADEPVYLSQVAPIMHYRAEPWPGTIFGGRFPIDVWPRPLLWAFEWHDVERELKIARAAPLFYC